MPSDVCVPPKKLDYLHFDEQKKKKIPLLCSLEVGVTVFV